MIPEEITEDLKKGMGLDECLKKHNTNLKDLFSDEYVPINAYIEKRCGKFHIKKKLRNKTYYFGKYSNLTDAQKVRNKLIEIGWKQNQVDSICKELGVKRIHGKNEERFYEE